MVIKLEDIMKIDFGRATELAKLIEVTDYNIDMLSGDSLAQARYYNLAKDQALNVYGDLIKEETDFINLYKQINQGR